MCHRWRAAEPHRATNRRCVCRVRLRRFEGQAMFRKGGRLSDAVTFRQIPMWPESFSRETSEILRPVPFWQCRRMCWGACRRIGQRSSLLGRWANSCSFQKKHSHHHHHPHPHPHPHPITSRFTVLDFIDFSVSMEGMPTGEIWCHAIPFGWNLTATCGDRSSKTNKLLSKVQPAKRWRLLRCGWLASWLILWLGWVKTLLKIVV